MVRANMKECAIIESVINRSAFLKIVLISAAAQTKNAIAANTTNERH